MLRPDYVLLNQRVLCMDFKIFFMCPDLKPRNIPSESLVEFAIAKFEKLCLLYSQVCLETISCQDFISGSPLAISNPGLAKFNIWLSKCQFTPCILSHSPLQGKQNDERCILPSIDWQELLHVRTKNQHTRRALSIPKIRC